MTDALPRLDQYLGHILEAIDRIGLYIGGMDEAAFLGNLMVQDAVVRNIEIIGEASNKIEKHFPAFAAEHPELPLTSAYQMRNAVAHGYFAVDFGVVWATIRRDLPSLRAGIEQARKGIVRR